MYVSGEPVSTTVDSQGMEIIEVELGITSDLKQARRFDDEHEASVARHFMTREAGHLRNSKFIIENLAA